MYNVWGLIRFEIVDVNVVKKGLKVNKLIIIENNEWGIYIF